MEAKDIYAECPYCFRETKVTHLDKKVNTCSNCFHFSGVFKTAKGKYVLHKKQNDYLSRAKRIDKTLYRDVIYTITDAEILKFNFLEEKVTFEDFFDNCNKSCYVPIRNTIIAKAHYLGISQSDIVEYFHENGAKLSISNISKIIKKYEDNTENEPTGSDIQLFSSELS